MPGEFHDGELHAQADAEIRNLVLTGKLNGSDHSLNAPLSESSGHKYAISVVKKITNTFFFDLFRIDKTQVYPAVVCDASMH